MFTDIFSWLLNLQPMEMLLWGIALVFSLLFVIQTILSLIGGAFSFFEDSGYDGGEDYDGESGFQFFTVRNMIVFFTMFGWTGLAAYKGGVGDFLTIVLALSSGVAMVFVMYLLMKNAHKLRQSGTLKVENAVNKIGEAYLRIPAQRSGTGKIHVVVQGRLVEMDAITDDPADIATGRPVQVVKILNGNVLIVTSNLIA